MTAVKMPKKFATVAASHGLARVPVWTADQVEQYTKERLAEVAAAVTARIQQDEEALREIGGMDNAMLAVPAGVVRELMYDIRKIVAHA